MVLKEQVHKTTHGRELRAKLDPSTLGTSAHSGRGGHCQQHGTGDLSILDERPEAGSGVRIAQ